MSAVATGPTIKRHQSSGDIWTPWEFIHAVQAKFGLIGWDLAATDESSKAHYKGYYLSEYQDSLTYSWTGLPCPHGDYRRKTPLLWLNPPYSNIAPWAKKCAEESRPGAEILLLVPMTGSNWYWKYVEPFADVYSVGRMVFDNCFDKYGNPVTTPYPKDLILCHYYPGAPKSKMQRWQWKAAK